MVKGVLTALRRNWLLSVFLVLLSIMIFVGSWSYTSAKEEMDRKSRIILQNATDTALTLIHSKQEELRRGGLSITEAQEQAKSALMGPKNPDGTRMVLQRFGLGDKGYLVIYDQAGLEIMHPTLEGQDVWLVKDYSPQQKYLVQELVQSAKDGGGFTRYVWYYPDTKEHAMKLAYSKLDTEWGWVISSTAYEEDFSSGTLAIMEAMMVLLCCLLLLAIIIVTMYMKYDREARNTIFNTLPHGFIYLDEEKNVLNINDAAASILECRREDIIGKPLSNCLASLYDMSGKQISENERPSVVGLRSGQVVRDVIVRAFVHGSETGKWLKINVIPLRTGLLGLKRQVYAHVEDVTHQVEQDQENKKLVLALNVAPVSVVITGPDANITYVNRAFETVSGYAFKEVVGKNPKLLQYDGGSNTDYAAMWATLLRGDVWRGEFVNKRKNGSRYYESSVIAPLKDDAGRITHYVAIKEDTTRLHMVNRRLSMTMKSLEDLVDIRTRDATLARDMTIDSMAILSEFRDNETGAHIQRTKYYVKLLLESIREKVHYKDHEIEQFWKSAPLHDIGKVAISDAILLKPGKLTPEEYEIMKNHVLYGHEALLRTEAQLGKPGYLKYAMEIVLGHHEKWDGSGYPKGLKGSQIPMSARVMAIADVYDALTSKRPYKEPFSHEKALEIIRKSAGSHFDPMLVKIFLEKQKEIRAIAEQNKE